MKQSDNWLWVAKALLLLIGGSLQGTGALAAAPDSETVAYTIKNGDTLLGLTVKYLTGANAYQTLVRVNDVADPERINPGRVIRVPVVLLRSASLDAKLASFKGAVSIVVAGKATSPRDRKSVV